MNMRRLLLPLLLIAAAAGAQTVPPAIPIDVEIGYRWLELKGDNGMYRTQVDEQSGLLLRALTYSTPDLRIDVSNLGTGPAGSARLEYRNANRFRFRLGYRTADVFSSVPSIAQHTMDRKRDMLDFDLEYLPEGKVTPFLSYSINRYSGPGTSTVHLGQDEFFLLSNIRDTDRELRGGVSFTTGRVYGVLTQGIRHYSSRETLTLAPGANAGNNSDLVIGRDITASGITRAGSFGGNTPFTNAYVTFQATKQFRVIGNYVRSVADADGSERELATGSFASFEISRFFNGLDETTTSRAKNSTWRGGVRGEFAIAPGVDLFGGFQQESRDLSGTALINSLFQQSTTFGGADPRDLLVVLDTASSIQREDNVANLGVSVRNLGPFAVRAEIRVNNVTADVDPDLAEIVVPGSQGGRFRRNINTFDTSASYTRNKLTLGAAWRHDDGDDPIFRTDFLARDRYRVRAQWASPKDYFRGGVTAEQTDQGNDRADTAFTARLRQYTGDVEVAPVEKFHLTGSYSQYRSRSDISFRLPQNFTLGDSFHLEQGRAVEGGFLLLFAPVTFDAGATRYTNTGTLPFKIDRYRARMMVDFKAHAGVTAEFNKDKYRDALYPVAAFNANRYGLYLRWRP
jgi:hypothetical protein